MGIRLDIEFWEIDKGGTKRRSGERVSGWVRGMGAAGFCGPCVCLGVFLSLQWRVLVSGIGGGWGCVQLVQ
jgi:hypothetical protein